MNIFDVGDRVALTHEKAEGIIISIHGNIVNVYLENIDMDIEIDAKQLLLIQKKAKSEPIAEQNHAPSLEKSDEDIHQKLDILKQAGIGHAAKPIVQHSIKKAEKIPIEIDLHWDVLKHANPSYLSIPNENIDEIFRIQRLEFENFFLRALAHNLSKITIIHGIGSGKLREYIHNYLKRHEKNILECQLTNEGGVTQVFFKLS